MKKSDIFKSAYLSASEVASPLTLTIHSVADVMVGHDEDRKLRAVMAFDEIDRKLIVNITNWNVLAEAFGEDSEDWIGNRIVLVSEPVLFKNKPARGIRVRIPRSKPKVKPAPITVTPSEPESEEEEDVGEFTDDARE